MDMNGKAVKTAMMHDNVFVVGIGDIRKELSSEDNGLTHGTRMTVVDQMVKLEFKGKAANARTRIIYVPLSNFKYLVFE